MNKQVLLNGIIRLQNEELTHIRLGYSLREEIISWDIKFFSWDKSNFLLIKQSGNAQQVSLFDLNSPDIEFVYNQAIEYMEEQTEKELALLPGDIDIIELLPNSGCSTEQTQKHYQ